MKVKDLIKQLQATDPERVVIMPIPGDVYTPVGEVLVDWTFCPEDSEMSWGYAGDDPTDDSPGGVSAVALWGKQ